MLVLVYVGAVMVLFLFVVMMLDIDLERAARGFTRYLPGSAGSSAGVVLVEMAGVVIGAQVGRQYPVAPPAAPRTTATPRGSGKALYHTIRLSVRDCGA